GNGNDALLRDGMSTSWLATALGVQSARVEAMRRSGELLGVRVPGRAGHVFPAWQFGRDGKPLASVQALIRASRARGLGDDRLFHILDMRTGLTSRKRVVDELRAG